MEIGYHFLTSKSDFGAHILGISPDWSCTIYGRPIGVHKMRSWHGAQTGSSVNTSGLSWPSMEPRLEVRQTLLDCLGPQWSPDWKFGKHLWTNEASTSAQIWNMGADMSPPWLPRGAWVSMSLHRPCFKALKRLPGRGKHNFIGNLP